MKKNIILSFLILFFLATACQEKNELEKKKEALSEKKAQMQELKAEINQLEQEIAARDTAFAKINRRAALVTTTSVIQKNFEHFVEVRGEVESDKNVNISAETAGRITSIPVEEGRQVQRGQVLLNINADVLRNNIEEVKTQYQLATTVYERQKNLWDQNIGTEVQFLEARNRKEALERQLATLQTQLNQSAVKAPFNGTVEEIMARQGEMASPGIPLVRLVSLQDLKVKASVSEQYIGQFEKGDTVEVSFPSLNKTIESTLVSVGQVINQNNRTFTIEARLPGDNELLKPNLLAVLKVKNFERDNAIVVPTNLIQRDRKGPYVYVVAGNNEVPQAKKVHIQTAVTYENQTLVERGLDANDVLVEQGFREVVDGMNLKIAESEEGISGK